ncbi:unnamed protein product [Rhizophagus irregularis]|nr:unnamed protein product [Rhizophagus irregularis]CAB5329274.1 unnamed protein product [Rhizophagus irregularis]
MKQCWDADPLKRPDAYTLGILSASKVHQFGFFSEPKNATEAYYSKSYDVFQIPDNIDDFNSKEAQIDNKIETMQQQTKNINVED